MLDFLLRIRSIKRLNVTFELSLMLKNDDLKAIGAAWPNLEYLSLPDNSSSIIAPLTFDGLYPLIQNCKNLEKLTIRINCEHRDMLCFSRSGSLGNLMRLTHLNFCTSPLHPYEDELI
ncbi:hypothetical protein H0H93_000333, partial [Arthromyces matolae]